MYPSNAADLQARIAAGEPPPAAQFPPITALMERNRVPGLNTIRPAQLVGGCGLVKTRQGVGWLMVRAESVPRAVDVLAELRAAGKSSPTFDTTILGLKRGRQLAGMLTRIGSQGAVSPRISSTSVAPVWPV